MRVCWRAPTCVNKTIEPDMHARRQRNHSILHNHKWMCTHACVNECLRVPSNVHKPLWGRTLICAHIMNITHARAQARHAQTHVYKAAHTATHACYHPCTYTHTRVEQAQTHRHIHRLHANTHNDKLVYIGTKPLCMGRRTRLCLKPCTHKQRFKT